MSAQQAEAIAAITAQLTEITEHLDSIKDLLPALLGQAAQPATDAPEPAQTLADLTPCLGDRVRAESCGEDRGVLTYAWMRAQGEYVWLGEEKVWWAVVDRLDQWTVLEHLDPVTPEEPPVGAGMLVDDGGDLWKRDQDGWTGREKRRDWWPFGVHWRVTLNEGPLRPATPADLAEHGVDEQGEPVGKGEADDERLSAACDWSDFRKDYGVSSDPELMQREHRAFLAGWQAGRHGDQSGVLR